ncbi:MAG: hypothetical protein P8183_13590, partial [Anaerolineae bacterium]
MDYTTNVFWRGSDVVTRTITLVPAAGINTSMPVYLNSGFALPGISCKPKDCDLHTLRSRSSTDIGSGIVLDVLPATLDGFYALDWGGKRPFSLQRDYDGDGLIAKTYGGSDPNDVIVGCPTGQSGPCWDSDGDGYSDKREVALQVDGNRNNPAVKDADSDGICDPEELRLGTDPQKADTDGDGLSDSEETWHYSCTTNTWGGGWAFQADSLSILMFSDPLVVDADGDGLSDKSERDLYGSQGNDDNGVPYHPQIPNDNPLRLTIDFSDDVVGANKPFVVTTTVRNDSSQWAYGTVTTNIPAAASNAGAATVTETFPNLNSGGEYYQQVIPLTSGANSTIATFTASAVVGANNGSIEPVWTWDPSNPAQTQTTQNYVYGIALTDVPAAAANQQGGAAFSAASLERPDSVTAYQPYPPLWSLVTANAVNRQIIGNGNYLSGFEINRNAGALENNSNMAVDTPPDVACNDAGDCLTISASAYWYNCKPATLDSINVIKQNDGSSDKPDGSEFYIVQNGDNWNDDFSGSNGKLLWPPEPRPASMKDNSNVPINVPFTWCEGDTLSLWEDDGGGKNDENYGPRSYTPSTYTPLNETHKFTYPTTANNNVDVEIFVTFNPTGENASPQWQAWDNQNCTNIQINSLFVKQSADGNTIGDPAEYYIQHNGPNRGTTSSNNAAGDLIWAASAGASTNATLAVNQGVWACRGDTIDVWEDDPGKEDDFICSIKVLSDAPANPSGDPNKTSEAGYPQTSTVLGWVAPSGGVCTNPNSNNEVELSLTVEPTAKYVMTAGVFNANGAVKTNADGLVVRPQFWDANAYAKYQSMSDPAVASDGQDFLAAWIRGDGLLEHRYIKLDDIKPDSTLRGTFTTRSAPAAATDVDLVYVQGGYYLWAMKGADNKIYLFYTDRTGSQQVGGYQTIAT